MNIALLKLQRASAAQCTKLLMLSLSLLLAASLNARSGANAGQSDSERSYPNIEVSQFKSKGTQGAVKSVERFNDVVFLIDKAVATGSMEDLKAAQERAHINLAILKSSVNAKIHADKAKEQGWNAHKVFKANLDEANQANVVVK